MGQKEHDLKRWLSKNGTCLQFVPEPLQEFVFTSWIETSLRSIQMDSEHEWKYSELGAIPK